VFQNNLSKTATQAKCRGGIAGKQNERVQSTAAMKKWLERAM
jgi:hypothetical protein